MGFRILPKNRLEIENYIKDAKNTSFRLFDRELALLVTLQGESIWKGWGGGEDIHSKVCGYALKSLRQRH